MSAQTTQLKRVRARLADAVLGFCRLNIGRTVRGSELHRYVADRVPLSAPGSADRVLRALRQDGTVQYTLVSRGGSVYQIDGVPA